MKLWKSRNEDLKNTNFLKSDWVWDIGLLKKEEQRELFCNILYDCKFNALDEKLQIKINEFLKNIPEMPLDVCAAAYYLKNTKISVDEYLKITKISHKELNDVQKSLLKVNVNYDKTRYSVISSVFK